MEDTNSLEQTGRESAIYNMFADLFTLKIPPAELYYFFVLSALLVLFCMSILIVYVSGSRLKNRVSASITFGTIAILYYIHTGFSALSRCSTNMVEVYNILYPSPLIFIVVATLTILIDKFLFYFCRIPHWLNILIVIIVLFLAFSDFLGLYINSCAQSSIDSPV